MEHTFVLSVYQESPYLEACIQSLIGQTAKSKIIIATSTPTTYSQSIADQYNIPYYINDSQVRGIANDWNFALLKADTELVTIAHQDDVYDSRYTEVVTNAIKHNSAQKIQIAFTNYSDLVNNELRSFSLNAFIKRSLLLPFIVSSVIRSSLLKKMILLFGDPICCPSVTFNMPELGDDFKFQPKYTCALDWYAWYELALRPGAFMYINKRLITHRIHPGSETTNQLAKGLRQKEELELFELMWGKRIAKLIARVYALGHKENLQ
ncbi:glycosyltransferase family A protein [Danxiaibacter flavus]|uniref:Glycosyltransferase family A protein n=1 Tax=Danxiaibacter flavus TaxID=3049108 RepID=A0ABV3ZJW1_9BACT|nr:glycosyltransferase family A protein [Chitinophagaceae bacterium DXS]